MTAAPVQVMYDPHTQSGFPWIVWTGDDIARYATQAEADRAAGVSVPAPAPAAVPAPAVVWSPARLHAAQGVALARRVPVWWRGWGPWQRVGAVAGAVVAAAILAAVAYVAVPVAVVWWVCRAWMKHRTTRPAPAAGAAAPTPPPATRRPRTRKAATR